MSKLQELDFVLAVENINGDVNYSRENFARLNPHVPNTIDNWYQWRMTVSLYRKQQAKERIHFEVQQEGVPF